MSQLWYIGTMMFNKLFLYYICIHDYIPWPGDAWYNPHSFNSSKRKTPGPAKHYCICSLHSWECSSPVFTEFATRGLSPSPPLSSPLKEKHTMPWPVAMPQLLWMQPGSDEVQLAAMRMPENFKIISKQYESTDWAWHSHLAQLIRDSCVLLILPVSVSHAYFSFAFSQNYTHLIHQWLLSQKSQITAMARWLLWC